MIYFEESDKYDKVKKKIKVQGCFLKSLIIKYDKINKKEIIPVKIISDITTKSRIRL